MIRNTLFPIINKSFSLNSNILKPHIFTIFKPFLNNYFFSTSGKQQYSKKFLIRLTFQHSSDAYYQTYPHRQQFRKQIKQLQDTNKCYLFGGDLFPMDGAIFVVNCDQKSFIEEFFNSKNVYAKNKLIQKVEIEEVEQISEEKMKKLTYFYQYK